MYAWLDVWLPTGLGILSVISRTKAETSGERTGHSSRSLPRYRFCLSNSLRRPGRSPFRGNTGIHIKKRIEEIVGGMKTMGGLRKTCVKGPGVIGLLKSNSSFP